MDRTKLNAFIDYVHQTNEAASSSRIHGLNHWRRVEAFGLLMAEVCPEADKEVISWFAYTHDSMRTDDGCCTEHGPNAAELINKVRDSYMSELSDKQIQKLRTACYHHTFEKNAEDITVDICFDADRLDLLRCGLTPDPQMMAGEIGAELAGVLATAADGYTDVHDLRPHSYDILFDYVYKKYKMTIEEAIKARHSVRQYTEQPLLDEHVSALQSKIESINANRGLHIQLIQNEPKAFSGFLARYIKFFGATNYIALVGRKADDLKEKLGYEGEKLVLMAQQMGLNTCWVAGSFSKNKAVQVAKDEKFVAVIAIGYGENQGKAHVSKPLGEIAAIAYTPDWFRKGVECAMLAPSAMNKQNFHFAHMADGKVMATAGHGAYAGLDLGIAKLHFEIGSGKDSEIWK